MTAGEIINQQEYLKKEAVEIERRRAQGVSGDDCDIEYKTNTKVCVEITGGNLDCNKSYSGNYYRNCDLSLNYDVQTNYQGKEYLDVKIECSVEIEYRGREIYSRRSDSSYQVKSYNLYAHGSDYGTMSFDFYFSRYKDVIRAKISSARCEVQSIDLW